MTPSFKGIAWSRRSSSLQNASLYFPPVPPNKKDTIPPSGASSPDAALVAPGGLLKLVRAKMALQPSPDPVLGQYLQRALALAQEFENVRKQNTREASARSAKESMQQHEQRARESMSQILEQTKSLPAVDASMARIVQDEELLAEFIAADQARYISEVQTALQSIFAELIALNAHDAAITIGLLRSQTRGRVSPAVVTGQIGRLTRLHNDLLRACDVQAEMQIFDILQRFQNMMQILHGKATAPTELLESIRAMMGSGPKMSADAERQSRSERAPWRTLLQKVLNIFTH